VPVVVDAAGQVYPLERFTSFTRLGADLVCFGAKYIGSVNSSGILVGKKDLVEAASMQGFIGFETVADHQAFGRPMKLDRQEVVAVVVALQEWFAMDHDRRLAEIDRRLQIVGSRLNGLPGVTLEYVKVDGSSPRVLQVKLDPTRARLSADAVAQRLSDGSPRIFLVTETDKVYVNPTCFMEGDEDVVGRRLAELLGRD
jgi:D-glucosaminate-6-phosphate ammonia-lyase